MTNEEKFLRAAATLAKEAKKAKTSELTKNHIIAVALTKKDHYEIIVRTKES